MIIPSLGSLENHTQDGQWKMSGQKYALSVSNPWMNQAFFLVMYACNGKMEFRTSDFNNTKAGHYWCSWRKNRKRKILLEHAFTF